MVAKELPVAAGGENQLGRNSAIAYRWIAVGISFLILSVSYGLRGAFSVFFVSFLEEFQKSRSSTAGVITLCYLIWAIVSPLVGTVVDRFGVRITFFLGGLCLFLGLALTSLTAEFWHLYLSFGICLSLGLALLDIIPITSYIDGWHTASKGRAFGIAFSGRGIGLILWLPLSQYLISAVGWRLSFQILGAILLGFVLFLCIGVRTPGNPRLGSAGAENPPSAPAGDSSVTTGEALKTLLFWRLFILRFFTSYGIYAVSVHLVAYLIDLGFSKMYAATITGFIGGLGFGGALLLGYASDYLGRGKSMIIGFLFSGLGVVFLILAKPFPAQWVILAFLALYGMGYGARGPVFAALASDLFSGKSLGRIYGLITLGVGLGEAVGPWAAGYLFDQSGSYFIPFISVLVSFAVSIALTVGIENARIEPVRVP